MLKPLLLSIAFAAPAAAQVAVLDTVVNPANGHTYLLLEEANWTDSEAEALIQGGHLVTINDQAENDWVFNTFGNWGGTPHGLWMGLTDEVVEGSFVWSSGQTPGFSNWSPGQPDNDLGLDPNGEQYVHMYAFGSQWGPGQWNDTVDVDPGTISWVAPHHGVIEIEGPAYTITGLVGGGIATLSVSNATASGNVLLAYSLTGAGPTATPFGPVDMSPPISQLPTLTADAFGNASLSTGIPGRATGFTLYTQGVDLTSGSLTNSLAEAIL